MPTFLHHGPCPRCGSKDNRGFYSDGGSYCFGCGFSVSGGRIEALKDAIRRRRAVDTDGGAVLSEEETNTDLHLPPDSAKTVPSRVKHWLAQCGLNGEDLEQVEFYWSEERKQLIFVFRDGVGRIRCTQARNFQTGGTNTRKYFNQGSTKNLLPLVEKAGKKEGGCEVASNLVAVEDVLSAIKLSRFVDAVPCLGTNLPYDKLLKIKERYKTLYVWLDGDKFDVAMKIASQAKQLGLESRAIYSKLDPKYYEVDQLKEFLK